MGVGIGLLLCIFVLTRRPIILALKARSSAHTPSTLEGPQVSITLLDSLPVSLPQDDAHSDALQAMLSGGLNYGLQPDQLGENMVSNDDWMSQNYMNLCNANNDLSLRLSAYSGPPIPNGGSLLDNQCSDMSCSDQHTPLNTASGKQSMSSGLNRILSQPRYLCVVQEILSQFASFSLENMYHQLSHSYIDHCADQGDSFKGSDESSNPGGAESLSHQRRDNEAKKSQLLALLQMLDDCYSQCLDEMHTVISAFHAATELDPKDAEKHLLAIKSGLTRSQVSNWFINARVRLWKPLIEEIYAELNRSRAVNEQQGNEEGSNTYNCLSSNHNSRYSAG